MRSLPCSPAPSPERPGLTFARLTTLVRRGSAELMRLEFHGEITYWRGPSPFHFIAVPEPGCREIRAISSLVTYGWGVIPVTVRIGETEWTTSLFPKNGGYLLPIKDVVRRAEGLALGDEPTVSLTIEA